MRIRMLLVFSLLVTLGITLTSCRKAAPATPEPTVPTPTIEPSPEPTKPIGGVDVAWEHIIKPDVPVVARVNSVEISTEAYLAELRWQLSYITEGYGVNWYDEQAQAYLPNFQDQVLQRMVQVELAQQLAKSEGIVIEDVELEAEATKAMEQVMSSGNYKTWEDFLARMSLSEETFQAQVRLSLIFQKLLEAHGGPEEVEQVHAAHILVDSEETAKEVLAKLQAGESFADLAKEYSTDTSSKDNGGDLGWFPREVMVSEFETVAFALSPGETSGVVQTQYGYHIIRVLEKEVRPLDPELLTPVRQHNFQVWFEAELEKADVETLVTFEQPSSQVNHSPATG